MKDRLVNIQTLGGGPAKQFKVQQWNSVYAVDVQVWSAGWVCALHLVPPAALWHIYKLLHTMDRFTPLLIRETILLPLHRSSLIEPTTSTVRSVNHLGPMVHTYMDS